MTLVDVPGRILFRDMMETMGVFTLARGCAVKSLDMWFFFGVLRARMLLFFWWPTAPGGDVPGVSSIFFVLPVSCVGGVSGLSVAKCIFCDKVICVAR
jgi:hypothetical protein